jgi:hypothetical protein
VSEEEEVGWKGVPSVEKRETWRVATATKVMEGARQRAEACQRHCGRCSREDCETCEASEREFQYEDIFRGEVVERKGWIPRRQGFIVGRVLARVLI